MRYYQHVVGVLFLLLFGCMCSVGMSQRCGFDRRMRRHEPLTVVREVPREGKAALQAYTIYTRAWEPLRIKVSAEDLNDGSRFCTAAGEYRPDFEGDEILCEASHILTLEKKNLFINQLLPEAIKLHTDRLLVRPVDTLKLRPFSTSACALFTIPNDHYFLGIFDADMVLYVAAGPTRNWEVGWAVPCSLGTDGRPVAGAMNFGPQYMSAKRGFSRAVAHEIAHALGFTYFIFKHKGMLLEKASVRDKRIASILYSRRTVEAVRKHFNCSAAFGMELEDEGGDGTAGSHWERRNAKDEMMAGVSGIAYYSALTMAAFEDMGYYRANWGMEELMSWGNNSGCKFLMGKCVKKGVVQFPEVFCDGTSTVFRCTSDRLALGVCSTHLVQSDPQQRYKNTSRFFGAPESELTDRCPIIVPEKHGVCGDIQNNRTGSLFGSSSRCVQGNSLTMNSEVVGDVCVDVSCRNKGNLYIRHIGNDTWHRCPEGEVFKPGPPFTGGVIVCPKYTDVCITVAGVNTRYKRYNLKLSEDGGGGKISVDDTGALTDDNDGNIVVCVPSLILLFLFATVLIIST